MTAWHASPFSGLFTRFGSTPTRPHDPAFAVYGGTAASWLGDRQTNTASGIGRDAAAAEASCVGEAIERLQAGPTPSDSTIEANYCDWPLEEPAVDPVKWILFHREQYQTAGFPFEPLTHETRCSWVCLRDALSGKPWWVPAELAFLHHPGGHRFGPGYSTGLAAGRRGHPLLLRGLQEVIERDAVVGAWWGRYPLEETPAAAAFALLGGDWRQRCERPNLTYRFYRILTPFSDHTTLVTLIGDDREGFLFSIGSACRETRAASWEKSLLEAIHGRHYVRYLKQEALDNAAYSGSRTVPRAACPPVRTLGDRRAGNTGGRAARGTVLNPFADDARASEQRGGPTSFAEHAVFYSLYPEQLPNTALANAKPAMHSEAASNSREDVSSLAARLGPDRPVLFRIMTPPALATERFDWQVLRVVVPGLQPLHGHHAFAHLGGPLWTPRGLTDWRTMPPHPFP